MDIHFNMYKVKYARLNQYFQTIKNSQPIHSINIFINLDDFFHSIHRPLTNNEFQMCGSNASKQLLSNLFNLLGHYYNWGIRHQQVPTRVFGVYTSTIRSFKNRIYLPDYRKRFRDNMDPMNTSYYFINEAIRDTMPLLTVTSNYIPNLYMIDSKYLEPSMIPFYLEEEVYPGDWNILISRDVYDVQYAYKDRWTLISPKGDNSYILNRGMIWNYVNNREKIFKEERSLQYNHELYVFVKAVIGDTYRAIPRLRKIGWKTIFKYLDEMQEKYGEHANRVLEEDFLIKMLQAKSVDRNSFENNFAATDVALQKKVMMEIDRSCIDSQLLDIPDYDNVAELNRTKLYKFPMNLDQIFSDTKYPLHRTPF